MSEVVSRIEFNLQDADTDNYNVDVLTENEEYMHSWEFSMVINGKKKYCGHLIHYENGEITASDIKDMATGENLESGCKEFDAIKEELDKAAKDNLEFYIRQRQKN